MSTETGPVRSNPAGRRIVVAGDALVDIIVRPGGELVPVGGGGPYNAVRAIARLGVPCSWIGGLSTDRFGRMLEAALVADGVSLDLAQRTDLPTTLALAELGGDGAAAYRFYTEGTSAPAVYPGPLAGGLPAGSRAVLTGTLGFVLEPMATTLEAWVAGLPDDVLVMFDPNCRPTITRDPDAYRERLGRVLARADIVKASGEDLAFLRPGATAAEAVAWLGSLGARLILVTDGGGPVTVHLDGRVRTLPTPPVRVVDTVGAGDTFGGAFLACLVHDGATHASLPDEAAVLKATRFAIRASALVCERAGADPPTLDELGGWPES